MHAFILLHTNFGAVHRQESPVLKAIHSLAVGGSFACREFHLHVLISSITVAIEWALLSGEYLHQLLLADNMHPDQYYLQNTYFLENKPCLFSFVLDTDIIYFLLYLKL